MLAKKIYIIKTKDNETSNDYVNFLLESIAKIKSIRKDHIEILEWPSNVEEAWEKVTHLKLKNHGQFVYEFAADNPDEIIQKAECVTLAHHYLWHKISEKDETSIILEHDVVLHKNPLYLNIPKDMIVGLGYKTKTPEIYQTEKIGLPREIVYVNKIMGAHAYALRPLTAFALYNDAKKNGLRGWIDCTHFQNGGKLKEIKMGMASPPPAQAWLRESTIWDGEPSDMNGYMIASYIDKLEKPGLEKIEEIYSNSEYYK